MQISRDPVVAGQKFNRLTVDCIVTRREGEEGVGKKSRNRKYCECTCECGTKVVVRLDYLLGGRVKSCGCFKSDYSRGVCRIGHRSVKNNETK